MKVTKQVDIESFQAIGQIASYVTTTTVLLAWLFREIKSRDKLSLEILDDYRDLKAVRVKRIENAPIVGDAE